MEPGLKDNTNKFKIGNVSLPALEQTSDAFEYGAGKYGRNNWRKPLKQMDILNAILRHVFKYINESDNDKESGIHHLAHASSNIHILLQQIHDGVSIDDRFIKQ